MGCMNHGSTLRNSEVPSKRVRRGYKEVIRIYAIRIDRDMWGGLSVWGLGCWALSFVFWVCRLGFRVQGLGF